MTQKIPYKYPYLIQSQLISVNFAIATILFMMIAMVFVGRWFPPIAPNLDAEQVALLFQENTNNYRFGGLLITLGAACFWPFGVAITEQMKRVEGYQHHPMATIQLFSLNTTICAIFVPGMLWMAAAFRPERMPDVTQALNDLGWLTFIGAFPPAVIQTLSIAYCVLNQTDSNRIFPKWFGYFNLWVATGFLTGALVPFTKEGAFAWNGLIAFWVAATFFFGWIIVSWYVVRQCIFQQAEALGFKQELSE